MTRARLPIRWLAALLLGAGAAAAHAGAAEPRSAGGLHAKYAELRPRLDNSPFGKPLTLESSESQDRVSGEVYAVVEHPFDASAAALGEARHWCEILLLPINTKYCRPAAGGETSLLQVGIGRKDDAPDKAYLLQFRHRVAIRSAGHLQVQLGADEGPFGTRDYRLTLDAVPVEGDRTFLRLAYSYGLGARAQLAMQMYLGTAGRDKVGFTVTGTRPGGEPVYVGGMRGVIERNAMRYYLAVEAFLDALSAPPQARLEKRLRGWFAAAERYRRQLHEVEQAEYLEMKRREHRAGPLA